MPDVPVGVADVALPPEGSVNVALTDVLVGTVTTGTAVTASAKEMTSHGGEIACPPAEEADTPVATTPVAGVGSVGSPCFSSFLQDFGNNREGLATSRASKKGWFFEGLEVVIFVFRDQDIIVVYGILSRC